MPSPRCFTSIIRARQGEWIPNQFGGRENLEADRISEEIQPLTQTEFPGVDDHRRGIHRVAAGDAPALYRRTRFFVQVEHGLDARHARLFQREPIHRKYHQNDLTFAMLYHHNENFILPLSHDEVVHGKGSLIGRMPGDDWQKFANLRALLAYQWLFPGKKLLFMGCEIGQTRRMERKRAARLVAARRGPYPSRPAKICRGLEPLYAGASGALAGRITTTAAFIGLTAATARTACFHLSAKKRRLESARRHFESHARAAPRLSHRPAARGQMAEVFEQRRGKFTAAATREISAA